MAATGTGSVKRAAILEAAAAVFLRFGFRKTSMDDLARAAGLSRQGLYLQFPTKEALFKDAVLNVIATTRARAAAALGRADGDVEDRLLDAFDALHGHAIGKPGSEHMAELLETATLLIGRVFEELEQAFVGDVARVLRSAGVADKWKASGVSARDLAVHLYTVSNGAKHRRGAHPEYREHMRTAIRIVCRAGDRGN